MNDLSEDLVDMIYRIQPSESPLFDETPSRRQLSPQFRSSMRARRKRLAKPVRFRPYTKPITLHFRVPENPPLWAFIRLHQLSD